MNFVLVILSALSFAVAEEAERAEASTAKDWAFACLKGQLSSGFDVLQTEKFDLWFNETSIMQLPQTGTYVGSDDIAEYVNFLFGPFFDYYESTRNWDYKIIKLEQDECVVVAAGSDKVQVNASMGKPVCLQTTLAYKLHWTVADLDGSGFLIHRINVLFSDVFVENLAENALNTDGIRDYVCDDVLMANCPETVALNQLTSDSCKERYDELPSINEGGYADGNTKACRFLHSVFAEINDKHCPHLSFVPEADYKNRTKCQESAGVLTEDLFSEDELTFIGDVAVKFGYDRLSKYKECEYKSVDDGSFVDGVLTKLIDMGNNFYKVLVIFYRLVEYMF